MPNSQDAYEWLDGNMHRNYPVSDSCTCLSNSGILLPSSFLVDMDITVPAAANGSPDRFFISAIMRHGDSVTVEISYHSDTVDILCAKSDPISLALRNTDTIEGTPSRTITLNSVLISQSNNDYAWLGSLSGSLIVGSCIDMSQLGNLTFQYAAAQILSVRVHRVPAGISSITAIDHAGGSINIRDNLVIQAGEGVDLSYYTDYETGEHILEISRIEPASATQYTTLEDIVDAALAQIGQPITRINGIAPDADGNLTIQGDDCTVVEPNGAGLFIQNSCAKPCCTSGDDGSADIQAAVDTMQESMGRLQEYYTALTQMVNLLQAKLASLIVSGR